MVNEQADQLSEPSLVKKLMPFTGNFAYKTVLLFTVSFIIYLMSSVAGVMAVVPLWLTCVINTICAYLLFTPMHEAVHQNIKGRLKKYSWFENLIGWISGMSLMSPFPVFSHLHIKHHGHTNHPEKDPDYWVAADNAITVFFRCMTTYFAYYHHYRKDRQKLWSNPETRWGLVASILAFVVMNGAITWTGIAFGWAYPLLIYVVPAYLALGFLAFAFDWLPHHPHAVQQRYLDTRIILKPGLSTILVSQNMHLIHHLYSGIPYYHYGEALEVLEEKLNKEGAEIQK